MIHFRNDNKSKIINAKMNRKSIANSVFYNCERVIFISLTLLDNY